MLHYAASWTTLTCACGSVFDTEDNLISHIANANDEERSESPPRTGGALGATAARGRTGARPDAPRVSEGPPRSQTDNHPSIRSGASVAQQLEMTSLMLNYAGRKAAKKDWVGSIAYLVQAIVGLMEVAEQQESVIQLLKNK